MGDPSSSDPRSNDPRRAAANLPEDRLLRALDASGTGVWEYTLATDTLYWSRVCREIAGLSEVAGTVQEFDALVHPDDLQRVRRTMGRAIAKRAPFECEYRLLRPDGSVRWVADRGACVCDENGEAVRVVGTSQDITEQRERLRALEEHASWYRQLVELSPDAIVIVRDDVIQLANRAAQALLGDGAPPALVGRLARDFFRPADHATNAAHVRALVQRGERALRVEQRLLRPDGSEVAVETSAVRIEHEGRPAILALLRDVTERARAEGALRANEERVRELLDSLPQHVWTTDPEGVFTYINRRLRDYTGMELPAANRWIEVLHPEDREQAMEKWGRVLATGDEIPNLARLRDQNGQYRWFDVRARPLRDESGRITQWIGSNTDVHEAWELERALRQEEQRIWKIASVAPGALYTFRWHADGRTSFPYASPQLERLHGSPAAEMARDAAPNGRRIHPDDVPRVVAARERAAATGSPMLCEFRYRHPDGREIWIDCRGTPEPDGEGGWLFHGIMLDVSERKRAEEALRTSRALLMTALRAGPMGTWTWDLATRRIQGDAAAASLWGFPAEPRETTWEELLTRFHPEERENAGLRQEVLVTTGFLESIPYRLLLPDGRERWIVTHAVVERDDAGRPVRLAGVHVDVTDRKRAEAALFRSQKLEALGTLAGGIAHDFNNVLAAILGNAELAMMQLPPDHPVSPIVSAISLAGSRAADLVRQILSFSRPREQARSPQPLAPIVDEAMRMVRATLPAMIDIRARLDLELPLVSLDATQLLQVLLNLTTNAAHSIGARPGRIEIASDAIVVEPGAAALDAGVAPGHWVRVAVTDDGAGMDAATLARAFDPFFTTKAPGEGSGLGLSVVHGILTSHGGFVTAESEPGKGSCFRLWLPVASRRAIEAASSIAPVAPRAAASRGGRVLYVDDEREIVRVAKRALELRGHEVATFTDPVAALAEFRARPFDFDLVITDLAMPGHSGFDLAISLLALRPDVPIVLTSGHLRAEDAERARVLGVRELMQKPIPLEQLVAAVGILVAGRV